MQTDANGTASTQVTLGGSPGPAKVTATAGALSATFNFTAQPSRPAILSGGVINAGAFGAQAGVAPGTWIEIYGTNLANDTRDWGSLDFNGNKAPTRLDNVQVTVNGMPAVISHVGAGQVNAQVPDNIGTGAVQLVVTNNGEASDRSRCKPRPSFPACWHHLRSTGRGNHTLFRSPPTAKLSSGSPTDFWEVVRLNPARLSRCMASALDR